jgi:hypothetical protein
LCFSLRGPCFCQKWWPQPWVNTARRRRTRHVLKLYMTQGDCHYDAKEDSHDFWESWGRVLATQTAKRPRIAAIGPAAALAAGGAGTSGLTKAACTRSRWHSRRAAPDSDVTLRAMRAHTRGWRIQLRYSQHVAGRPCACVVGWRSRLATGANERTRTRSRLRQRQQPLLGVTAQVGTEVARSGLRLQ